MQGGAPFPLTNSLFRPPRRTSPRSHASGTALSDRGGGEDLEAVLWSWERES